MEGSSFVFGIILTLVIVFFVNSCSTITDGVLPADYFQADAACEHGNGIKKVYRPDYGDGEFRTVCNDGRQVILTSTASEFRAR